MRIRHSKRRYYDQQCLRWDVFQKFKLSGLFSGISGRTNCFVMQIDDSAIGCLQNAEYVLNNEQFFSGTCIYFNSFYLCLPPTDVCTSFVWVYKEVHKISSTISINENNTTTTFNYKDTKKSDFKKLYKSNNALVFFFELFSWSCLNRFRQCVEEFYRLVRRTISTPA